MTTRVTATVVDGWLKQDRKLELADETRVSLIIEPLAQRLETVEAWRSLKSWIQLAHRTNGLSRKETDMDDILREVRKAREAYAKKFGYDLQAIHSDLKAREQASGRRTGRLHVES